MRKRALVMVALGAAARLLLASACSAAEVRDIHAVTCATATSIVVDIDGEFRYRSHSSGDGKAVLVDIGDATLAPDAPRLVPVSDSRIDGVLVLADAQAGIVRVSVDVAGRVAPHLDARIDGSRLLLTFAELPESSAAAASDGDRQVGGSPDSGGSGSPLAHDFSASSETPSRLALKHLRDERVRLAVADVPKVARSQKEGAQEREDAAPRRVPTVAAPASAARRSVVEKPMIVLDPGHGGKDPGASAWTGEFEKDIVLDLAERVARRLRKSGEVEVVMTRSGDEFVALADRRDASRRWGADVFVSIHANASHSASARGIETYYHTRTTGVVGASTASGRGIRRLARAENGGRLMRDPSTGASGILRASAASSTGPVLDRRPESARLAHLVQNELVRQLGMRYETVRDLGAKEGPFFVIGNNAAPSVLVEAAFLTHREEGLRMRSEVYREQIADGVSRGILAFVEEQRHSGAL